MCLLILWSVWVCSPLALWLHYSTICHRFRQLAWLGSFSPRIQWNESLAHSLLVNHPRWPAWHRVWVHVSLTKLREQGEMLKVGDRRPSGIFYFFFTLHSQLWAEEFFYCGGSRWLPPIETVAACITQSFTGTVKPCNLRLPVELMETPDRSAAGRRSFKPRCENTAATWLQFLQKQLWCPALLSVCWPKLHPLIFVIFGHIILCIIYTKYL